MVTKTALLRVLMCLVVAIASGGLFAAERMTVAVLDLTPKGVPGIVSGAVSDIMRAEFSNYANFTVVARNQMKEILEEQSFQMTGCTDEGCAVQAGKLLSARRIITGEVTALGKNIVITVRYLDVEKGTSLFSERGTSASIDVVDRTATEVAKRLAQRIVGGDREVIEPKTRIGYFSRGLVPGWGQLYAGRQEKSYAFFGALGLTGGFAGYAYYNYSNKKSAYENQGPPQAEMDRAFDEYDKAAKLVTYSLVALGAVLVVNYLDILFLSTPNFDIAVTGAPAAGADNSLCYGDRSARERFLDDGFYISVGTRF